MYIRGAVFVQHTAVYFVCLSSDVAVVVGVCLWDVGRKRTQRNKEPSLVGLAFRKGGKRLGEKREQRREEEE